MVKTGESAETGTAAFDPREFRNALGRFATGITVITTMGPNGKPEGLTANSFTAVSLDPPLILWCLGKSAASLPAFDGCRYFAVNILDAKQRALSHRFAMRMKDKFADLDWDRGLGNVPIFPGCVARFECRTARKYDAGDHVIFIGAVERSSHTDGNPLLFNAGKYGTAAAHPDDHGKPVESSDFADLLL